MSYPPSNVTCFSWRPTLPSSPWNACWLDLPDSHRCLFNLCANYQTEGMVSINVSVNCGWRLAWICNAKFLNGKEKTLKKIIKMIKSSKGLRTLFLPFLPLVPVFLRALGCQWNPGTTMKHVMSLVSKAQLLSFPQWTEKKNMNIYIS